MRHGLTVAGRYLVVRTRISDRPGDLAKLLNLIAEERVSVVSVEHHREGMSLSLAETEVSLTLVTRDEEHCEALLEAMRTRRLQPGAAPLARPCAHEHKDGC